MRFRFIVTTLLIIHALVHPALHGPARIPAGTVVVSAPLPPGQQSRAEPKPVCVGCRVGRRLDLAPLLPVFFPPAPRWEYLLVGLQPGVPSAAEVPSPSTRAPPSS